MSNIHTSYLRIYRNDNAEIKAAEIDFITKYIVKWHDEFGSYHIPVLIEKNTEFNCIDIQYGSGKGGYHLYDFMDEHENTYTIWHRFNDSGGGVDRIERVYSPYKKDIPEYDFRPCNYVFDEIHSLNCPLEILNSTKLDWISSDNGFKTSLKGFYHSINAQFGEGKIIEAAQKYDLLRPMDLLEWCSEKNVMDLLELLQKNIGGEVLFFYKKRKVCHFSWNKAEHYFNPNKMINGMELTGFASDDWDNCADEHFLQFNDSYKL